MTNTKNWKTIKEGAGVKVVQLSSWKYFADYIYQIFSNTRDYIFRGHRKENWSLTPTLYRDLGEEWTRDNIIKITNGHFDRFHLATRGRIKTSFSEFDDWENELWALGQHQGLKTPLLDWTKSPFVAAYFAFLVNRPDKTDNRVVFAFSKMVIEEMSHWIANNLDNLGLKRVETLKIFEPESNENPNLVNQDGLFTIGREIQEIQSWVKSFYLKWIENNPLPNKKTALFKILIPDKDRIGFLKSLNQMNINHLTLFPNLYGASKYCNFELEIQDD
jgi:hypothetical protein